MNCKVLGVQQANSYLRNVGMVVGNWNELREPLEPVGMTWAVYKAPVAGHELYTFSQHAAGWLPNGSWMLMQIDNSTEMRLDQTDCVLNALGLREVRSTLAGFAERSVFYELEPNEAWVPTSCLLLAKVIFFSLLFEWHVYVVTSERPSGEYLNLHDGFIYFHGTEKSVARAKVILDCFDKHRRSTAPWLAGVIAAEQNQVSGSEGSIRSEGTCLDD